MILPGYALIKIERRNNLDHFTLYFPNLSTKILPPIVAGFNNNYKNFRIKKNIYNSDEAFLIKLRKIDNYYKIGPLVGILTTSGPKGFKGNRKNFIDLIKMGIKNGVLIYIITAESIDKDKKIVDGYFYLPSKKIWIVKKMPFPDVIYNRISSRNEENRETSKEIINYIKNENIPFFNQEFFSKWNLYNWMKNDNNYISLIPKTTELNIENLKEMLNSYKMLYLKPNNGKAGIGIIKIERENNIYKLTNQYSAKGNYRVYNNFNSLWLSISELIINKKYIIQRGIKLKTYQDNPYDIRVLIQKNDKGNWQVTGIGVRVAGRNSITTHVPRGGYIVSAKKVFNHSFGKYSKNCEEAIRKISIDIAKHIEKKYVNVLGELSLDLGIDQDNNFWFFEANSKPMKFDESIIRYTSLLRLTQYFKFLSGFTE